MVPALHESALLDSPAAIDDAVRPRGAKCSSTAVAFKNGRATRTLLLHLRIVFSTIMSLPK